MRQQWNVYATDPAGDIAFLVVSSDDVNTVFPYVTVVPVVPLKEGRQVYPIEAVLPDSFSAGSAVASVALVHQIRTIKADGLTDPRGTVNDEAVRSAVREAMIAFFGL